MNIWTHSTLWLELRWLVRLFKKSKSGEILKTTKKIKNPAVVKSQGLLLQIVHHDSVKGLKNWSVNENIQNEWKLNKKPEIQEDSGFLEIS